MLCERCFVKKPVASFFEQLSIPSRVLKLYYVDLLYSLVRAANFQVGLIDGVDVLLQVHNGCLEGL